MARRAEHGRPHPPPVGFRVSATEQARALEFLGELEMAEARLLTWGIVDGYFTRDEVVAHARRFLDGHDDLVFDDAEALLSWLEDARLLWSVDVERYRTRMAEAVRLLARLRQIFPGSSSRQWRTARSLVADFRLLLRPRSFPKRTITVDACLEALSEDRPLHPAARAAVRAMLRADAAEPLGLARFQVDAARAVLSRLASARRARGTIVCAGTGSGKTLAFYLPAFAALAAWSDEPAAVRCLAIYPRNELLKDQFREALGQAARINAAVRGGRPLVLGALFGDVPAHHQQLRGDAVKPGGYLAAWSPVGAGLRCPLSDCPKCQRRLVWRFEDLRDGVERLVCERGDFSIGPDQIRLTRNRMRAEPPDVLFTSTEMLNQRMATDLGALFGVGVPERHRPRIVLLDEVHTYEGEHGAQVALLLRRWQDLADVRPHFVGLSATLADAPRFFADLIGVVPTEVVEVSPAEDDLQHEGMEYLLAVRGDPVSGASLLSTSIQTAMLMRRVLEPRPERSAFGQKVFVFTDNLDVNNRLYFDTRDAEGWRGNTISQQGSLATLRASTLPEHGARLAAGQSWDLVECIGHSLAPGAAAAVERVSSLDPGIDRRAEIVVATASLEVGFDDAHVGAVMQHKAPRSAAAFLQRKGRAGRRREMRPWTVVVLSDYGRDRLAYQSYEQLFAPVLAPRRLPIGNRHVQKTQAAWCLVEWIAATLREETGAPADLWNDLSGPSDVVASGAPDGARRRQRRAAELLRGVLEDPATRGACLAHVQRALRLDDAALREVAWEPPRALVTAVVPTWLRRLEREWAVATGKDAAREVFVRRAPLPEFAPRTLFSDLNTPEVEITLRNLRRELVVAMPVAQALREFAPGRVSHRFSVDHILQRNWFPIDVAAKTTDLDAFVAPGAFEVIGRHPLSDDGGEVDVLRPFRVAVPEPGDDVASSSNAFPRWRTALRALGDGHALDLPAGTRWSPLIDALRVHTHSLADPVEVTRYTPGADVSFRDADGGGFEGYVELSRAVDGSRVPTALGFTADVDAVAFAPRPVDMVAACVRDGELLRALRVALFRDRVRGDARLDGVVNIFARQWLADAWFAAAVLGAARDEVPLEAAAARVRDGGPAALDAMLDALFLASAAPDSDDDDHARGRRHQELRDHLRDASVRAVLAEAATTLWQAPDATWESWLRARLRATLGAAVVEAVRALCPYVDADDLHPEVDLRGETLWITEAALGGAAVVDEFLVKYGEDPRRFFELLDAALEPSDLEEIDGQLRLLVDWIATDSAVADLAAAVRQGSGHAAAVRCAAELRRELATRGMVVSQTVISAIYARVLRPGSGPATDALLARVLAEWDALETRLGVEIDQRTVALVVSARDDLDLALAHLDAPAGDRVAWRYSVLSGVLWPRGAAVRAESLRVANPFARPPETDKRLLQAVLPSTDIEVSTEDPRWFEEAVAALTRRGRVVLTAADGAALRGAITRFLVEPVDTDALLVHARVRGARRRGRRVAAVLDLPEVVQ